MTEALATLTELEKDTLRLLLAGHDAKSIARECDLSVHTINDRLRSTRRKLGVTSSREAARILGEAERNDPQFLADKQIGVAGSATGDHIPQQVQLRRGTGTRLAWLAGGLVMIGLLVALAMLPSAPENSAALQRQGAIPGETSTQVAQADSVSAARAWVAQVDDQDWAQSYRTSGAFFQAQLTQDQWAATIAPVRQPLGAVASRTFGQVTKTDGLPGAPAGEYQVIEFITDFANKSGSVETVVLIHEASGWKVVGYFIR